VSAESRSPAPSRRPAARRRLAAVALLLALAGAGLWYWGHHPPAARPEPPLPAGIADAEVKAVLESGRAKVLADPDSARAWGEYGLLLLAHLFADEADACFARASELDTSDPRWPYARSLIALKRDPQNAPGLLRKTVDTHGDAEYVAAARLTLAETLLERGSLDEAEALFLESLGPDPGQPRALLGLGLVAAARGDDAAATKFLTAARSSPFARRQAAARLAALARARGDAKAAAGLEQEAANLPQDPPWPDPILDGVLDLQVGHRGRERRIARLEQEGRFAEAIAEYQAQLAIGRTAKALTGAAVNLARLREYDEALKLLREAVAGEPADPLARYTLTLVLFTKTEKEWYADPESPAVHAALREVIEEAKRTIELKPDQAEAYLFWGLSLRFLGEPAKALDPLRKGLGVQPDHFALLLALGQVLAATGDSAGAERALENARKIRPDDPRPAQELEKLKGKK
jgi:tetratricopeptide (TPR) repeat protein